MAKTIKPIQLGGAISEILKEFEKVTVVKADKALRATVIKVWGDIILQTPVDTGRARSNWFIGKVPTNAINDGVGVTSVADTTPFKLFGKKLFLFNNLPYITRLEFGHSKQAPVGMVRKNVAIFPGILRKAFKQV